MKKSAVPNWIHILLTGFLSAYLTFVFSANSLIDTFVERSNELGQAQSLAIYLLFAILLFAFFFVGLSVLVKRWKLCFHCNSVRKPLSVKVFAGVALAVFLIYLTYLFAEYPGGFSPDTQTQWEQAHTGHFNDHHPVFHTFFFVLLTAIWDNYTFMLLVQLLAFACAAGYLAATMHAWGFRLSVVLVICFSFALTQPSRHILMFFWKDTTLSIFFLFLLSHIFNIMLTRGEWLKKPANWITSAVLLACITLFRHNAILYTAPLLLLMLIDLPGARRTCLKLTALVLVLVIGVKGPLYSFCNVEKNNDTYLETTGLPMTILFSSYVYSPETLSDEAYFFLERFVDHETAVNDYVFGNYNSLKWTWGMDYDEAQQLISEMPIGDFLRITLETIQGHSTLALQSVFRLTGMVWDPLSTQYGLTSPPSGAAPELLSIPDEWQSRSQTFWQLMDGVFSGHIFQKLTSQLGVLNLLMLLACFISIYRFRGWSSLWLILPVLCYNFGTMLLLCGPDYRFFHFNCLAVYPLIVLLLSRAREAKM